MQTNPLVSYLGKQSYPAILLSITEKIRDAQADTIVGNQLLQNVYKDLCESIAPIMQLKAFTTNAESMASNDAKLIDVINFARKEVKSGDLNFLVNVAKEEHLQNLSRTGFPSPESTLKEISDMFNEPASVIEQGIKNGIFDSLESNLLNLIKNDLIEDKSKNSINTNSEISNLNESYLFGNTAIYSPVAVRLEDMNSGKVVFLTESCVLTINGVDQDLCMEVNPESVEIPLAHKRLMGALSNLNYDPINNEFGLTQDWDFTLELLDAGTVVIGREGIDRKIIVENSDVPTLLLESIQLYSESRQNFNKIAFSQDADNFIMLMENHSKLIRLDECKTIKNIDSNEYVIVNLSESTNPKLIASSNPENLNFSSYKDLSESVSALVGNNVDKLFESQLMFEQTTINERFAKLHDLCESQKGLNVLISENKRLQNIAEKDSPAMNTLFEQSNKLNIALEKNFEALTSMDDANFKFY